MQEVTSHSSTENLVPFGLRGEPNVQLHREVIANIASERLKASSTLRSEIIELAHFADLKKYLQARSLSDEEAQKILQSRSS